MTEIFISIIPIIQGTFCIVTTVAAIILIKEKIEFNKITKEIKTKDKKEK